MDNFFPDQMADAAYEEIRHRPVGDFDSYDNPFERKLTLKKSTLSTQDAITPLIMWMDASLVMMCSKIFLTPLLTDRSSHYTGIFRYQESGYLLPHVDAGIHPTAQPRLRKHITALLYLGGVGVSGGELELWDGARCTDPEPIITELVASIPATHNTLVLFENNDWAWHGVAPYQVVESGSERQVITVSFLSTRLEALWFTNKRERAYFVSRPGEVWSPEMAALRDNRADPEKFAEVYHVQV